jgi:hypothetical protein
MILKHVCTILIALVVASPAIAQDGPIGIAFAEAPEQSSGVCTGQSTDKTLACARQKCVEGGAMAQDCLRVKWCYPAGWSADLVRPAQGRHPLARVSVRLGFEGSADGSG